VLVGDSSAKLRLLGNGAVEGILACGLGVGVQSESRSKERGLRRRGVPVSEMPKPVATVAVSCVLDSSSRALLLRYLFV
jgi:hypothetical protein